MTWCLRGKNKKQEGLMQFNRIITFLILIIFLGFFSGNTYAATLIWTNGGGDNLASTAANWSGGKAPQNGDINEKKF